MKKLISISLGVFIVLGIVSYFLLMPKPVYGWRACSEEYDECMGSAESRLKRCIENCEKNTRSFFKQMLCESSCQFFFGMDRANCRARLACCWVFGIFKIC